MELKLNWTEYSRNELRKIFLYYKSESNLKTAKNKVEEISKEVLILQKYPFIGQKEELLADRKEEFRYFLHANYKIIYLCQFRDKLSRNCRYFRLPTGTFKN